MTGRIRLHLPHPRRTARQRRAQQQRALVRRAGLADRTPQTWDGFARDGRPT